MKEREGGLGTPKRARSGGPAGAALAGACGWAARVAATCPRAARGSTRPGCCILRARWVQVTDKSLGKAISLFLFSFFLFFFSFASKKAAAPRGFRLLGQSTLVALPFFTCQPSRKYCTGSLGRVCGTVSKACCPVGVNSLMVKSRLTL